jgi:nucleotide-binding universal stress UspA family protein
VAPIDNRSEDADLAQGIGTLTNRPVRPARADGPISIRRILLALDPGGSHKAALDWTESLCGTFRNARVTVASVLTGEEAVRDFADTQFGRLDPDEIRQRERDDAEGVYKQAHARLSKVARAVDRVLTRGFPSQELVKLARKTRADLIIVGSHEHGRVERLLLGSVADAVKHYAPCHVLIAKSSPQSGPILAPVDGSEPSRLAAQLALRLAKASREPAHILHVFGLNILRYAEIGEEEFRKVIQKHRLPPRSKKIHYALDFGNPGKQIVKYAKDRKASLIVMGSRGLGPLRSALMGGVSNRVSHESPVSCLFVKT